MDIRRSLAIAVLLLVPALAARSEGAPLQVKQIAPDFTSEQLAPDIYAFISNNTTHDWEDGNSTIIIGDRCVVVVDAPASYLAARHLAQIRNLTRKPVCYVVNTHFHRDHMMGNDVYKDAFPGVQIVQQDYTATMSDRRGPAFFAALQGKSGAALLKNLEDTATKSVDASGTHLSGYDLDRARRSYREFLPVYKSVQNDHYVPADVTFDSTMTIRLGTTELDLVHMIGHTPGDTIVWLPKERILITGDLVIAPVPYGGPDYYVEWIASLDRLLAYDAAAIVPGHGEVEFSNDYMTTERDLFRSLMDQAVTAVSQGRSLDDFKKSLDLKALETKLVHGDPELQWGWDHYFTGTGGQLATRAYRTAYGAL